MLIAVLHYENTEVKKKQVLLSKILSLVGNRREQAITMEPKYWQEVSTGGSKITS